MMEAFWLLDRCVAGSLSKSNSTKLTHVCSRLSRCQKTSCVAAKTSSHMLVVVLRICSIQLHPECATRCTWHELIHSQGHFNYTKNVFIIQQLRGNQKTVRCNQSAILFISFQNKNYFVQHFCFNLN